MSFSVRSVLISESVDPSCARILEANGIAVTTKTNLPKEELIEEIKKHDGLIVRSATKVTADIIDQADQLKVIGRAGTGVDNIDCNAATRRGILVLNAPGGNALSAAELTCAMIVSLSRNIPQACASLKSGKWDRKSFMGNELFGKTLGIIGLGRIGREVATRMQSFGMKTVGFDPLVPPDVSKGFGVEGLTLEEMWPICDYFTVHTPLIPQTKNLINEEVFAKCKKGVKIVNCARGGIVDEDALVKALDDGQCGGAGFDVFLEEPPKNTALVQHPKMICTPHLGASTHEAQTKVAEEIALQIVDIVNNRFVLGVVNSPIFCHSLNEINRPWVKLCNALGKLIGTLFSSGSSITGCLTVYGPKLQENHKMLSQSSLVGILKKQAKSEANLINAAVLAKEAGIEVTSTYCCDTPNELTSFFSSVMLTATSSEKTHAVMASILGDRPVLCAVSGCAFQPPVALEGQLIFCHGKDNGNNLVVKLITALTEVGKLQAAYVSTPINDEIWCVFKVEEPIGEVPSSISDIVDFWDETNF